MEEQTLTPTQSLEKIPLFAGLETSILEHLSRCLRRKTYSSGSTIFRAKSPGDALYVVVEGVVKVSLTGDGGQEIILDTLGTGDFFGEMSLLDTEPRSADVVCLSQVVVLVLERTEFLKVLGAEIKLAVHITQSLSQRLRLADESIGLLSLAQLPPAQQVSQGPQGPKDRRMKLLERFIAEGIPFNAHLGVRAEVLEPGYAVLRIPFREELIGDPFRPAIHGGVISTLCDTAGGGACFALLKDASDRVSTIDLRVDYLRPGPPQDLVCEARVVRMGNRVAQTTMSVFPSRLPERNGDKTDPIATAHGVYSVRRLEK